MQKLVANPLTELDRESLLLRCAHLFYNDKMNIQTIGTKLGISRFRVSRYLREAEEKGIVKIEINDDKLIYESLACDLQKKYGVGRVIIVPVTATMDEDLVRKMVGQKCAELLASVRQDFTIGITWGRTIAHMTESVPESGLKVRRVAELTGGPGLIDAGIPTNTLAMFARKLLTHCYQMPSPIIVSSVEIGRSLKQDRSIRTTLEMSKTSEIAICGIATLDNRSMLFRAGFIDEADLAYLKAKGAVGSILGRFFDKDGQEIDSEFKERVISVDFEDFRKIPERIILAGGWGKAECIRGLLRGGLVSTIITDNITASALA
jgi:DNA-binding transcriptional regulator LsrR (DeoR family)